MVVFCLFVCLFVFPLAYALKSRPIEVKINKINKLEFAVAPPHGGSSSTDFRWNLKMLVFVEGREQENPEKTLGAGTRTNTKFNPHMTPGPGIEPGPHFF